MGCSEAALWGGTEKVETLAIMYRPVVLSCVKIVQEKVGLVSVASDVSRDSGQVLRTKLIWDC